MARTRTLMSTVSDFLMLEEVTSGVLQVPLSFALLRGRRTDVPKSGGHRRDTDTAVPGSAPGSAARTTAFATEWSTAFYTEGRLAFAPSPRGI